MLRFISTDFTNHAEKVFHLKKVIDRLGSELFGTDEQRLRLSDDLRVEGCCSADFCIEERL